MELRNNQAVKIMNLIDVKVLEGAYSELESRWGSFISYSTCTRVYMVTEGTGILKSENEEIIMSPGNVYIIPYGMKFSFKTDTFLKKLWFHVQIPKMVEHDLLNGINRFAIVPFSTDEIKKAIDIFNGTQMSDILYIKSLLSSLLGKAISTYGIDLHAIPEFSETVQKCLEYINENLSVNLSINALCGILGVSKTKLESIFKQEVGISIGKYIDSQIMDMAITQLTNTDLSIKEISYQLGFNDQFYFSRCFRNRYKFTPSGYRKSIKGAFYDSIK